MSWRLIDINGCLCESGLFRHLGAGVSADGPRNLYHGPVFMRCRVGGARGGAAVPSQPRGSPTRRRHRPDDADDAAGFEEGPRERADRNWNSKFGAPTRPVPVTVRNVHAGAGPITHRRPPRENTSSRNRVTIICGETGCGKSSRLPLMLLESDAKAKMFVSQPRRIAARALCDRVRQSLGDEVGLRLGFGERDESRKTRLWFCSTGYLVRLVAHTRIVALKTHTHIIVDEVHERSVDTEILCLLLRRLVQEHPTIRVVLMSATVCVDLYASYFGVDPNKLTTRRCATISRRRVLR